MFDDKGIIARLELILAALGLETSGESTSLSAVKTSVDAVKTSTDATGTALGTGGTLAGKLDLSNWPEVAGDSQEINLDPTTQNPTTILLKRGGTTSLTLTYDYATPNKITVTAS